MAETELQKNKTYSEIRSLLQTMGVDVSSLTDKQLKNNLQSVLTEKELPKDETIDLAYKISTDYIETAIKRFDRIDDKIQTLFTFAIGVFAIAPTLLKENTAAGKVNIYFWLGIGLLIFAGIISIAARTYGKLKILNPKLIYEKGLSLDINSFKHSVVKVAADAYEENSKVLENKHRLNILSMTIFGLSLISLVYWLVRFAI